MPLLVFTVLRRSPDQADAALLAARLAPAVAADTHGPAAEILRAAIDAAAREGDADTLDVRPQVLVGDAADALRAGLGAARACSCSARAPTGRPASCCRAAPRAGCCAVRAARCCWSRAPRSPRPRRGGGA